MIKQNYVSALRTSKRGMGFASRLFWEKRAAKYPRPFGRKSRLRTDRVIGIMGKKGIPVAGAHILDIGSGPGIFSLPFALKGAFVTALDISDNMLSRISSEAERLKITKLPTIRASWKEIDPAGEGMRKAFDLVFASLSIAVENEEDLLKMEYCSRKWCVVVAAGKIARHPFAEKALMSLGLPTGPRPDVRRIRENLSRMGRSFSYETFPMFIHEKKSISKMAEDTAKIFESHRKKPDREKIRATFSSLFRGVEPNRAIVSNRCTNIGVLIWRVDENYAP